MNREVGGHGGAIFVPRFERGMAVAVMDGGWMVVGRGIGDHCVGGDIVGGGQKNDRAALLIGGKRGVGAFGDSNGVACTIDIGNHGVLWADNAVIGL